jgi:uncharacterized protein (UPF0548 family)
VRRPTLSRRLATAARWPVGVALTSWRYLWRTTPLYRDETEGSWEQDAPPTLPDDVDREDVQWVHDGAGPHFHRSYSVRIAGSTLSAEQLARVVMEDPDRAAPSEFATFQKLHGAEGALRVNDEFVVRMPGPWDGPVRVASTTPRSFRFVTLAGHLEAGQIEFRASNGELLEFQIESWARSGDRLSELLYDRLRLSKEVQFHMWTSFLERVVKLSGGTRAGGLRIHTRRVAEVPLTGEGTLRDAAARRALDELHDKPLNVDLATRDEWTESHGWRIDDYCQPLPGEGPGPPEPGGPWERARRLMTDYEFADPAIVRAVYHPDQPLERRDMLLEVRFWGMRFRFGVRVGGVIDTTRTIDGRQVQVWGWNYATVQGHLETGQMDFEVWKWLDSGEVQFRIHVVSRASRIRNPIVRLGLRLFARREQVRFARRACDRMACLVAGGQEVPPAADIAVAGPATRRTR